MSDNLPFKSIPPPPREPVKGRLLSIAGWIVVFASVLFIIIPLNFVESLENEVVILLFLVPLLFATLKMYSWGISLITKGRQKRLPGAVEILEDTDQPVMLFLRSFKDDDLIDFATVLSKNPFERSIPVRYEERLAKVFRTVGSVVAIGQPGEPEPRTGALRLYVSNEEWQNAVLYMMERAIIVIITVGRTQSLRWEVQNSFERLGADRLLFFFPYSLPEAIHKSYWRTLFFSDPLWGYRKRKKYYPEMEEERQSRYRTFRSNFQSTLEHPLPEELGSSQFLHFDKQGGFSLLPRVKPFFLFRKLGMQYSRFYTNWKKELLPFMNKLDRPRGLAE
jgi:hypothetical protein